jgi:tetratricopeptide (TPR) repeat protein
LVATGRVDEGFVEYDRALELDPLNVTILTTVANAYSAVGGDNDRALELFARADAIEPRAAPVRLLAQIAALGRAGRVEEAARAVGKLGVPPEVEARYPAIWREDARYRGT